MMHNAPASTGTANAANHLDNYNRAEHTPQPSGIVDTTSRYAIYVALRFLPALARITEPYLAVTKCNHTGDCHTATAN